MKYIFQPHPQPLSGVRRGERLCQQMRGEVTTVLHRSENRYKAPKQGGTPIYHKPMLEDFTEQNENESTTYAEDTTLPKDLAEYILKEKQRQEDTIHTRKKILQFFLSWSFHATGIAIAKWCLVLGGGGALWMAASLCFTVSLVPASFIASSINVNFTDGRFEVANMQNLGSTAIRVGAAGITTWLAIKEYQALNQMTQQAVTEISENIRVVQKQYPQSDPWLSIGITTLIVVLSMWGIYLFSKR